MIRGLANPKSGVRGGGVHLHLSKVCGEAGAEGRLGLLRVNGHYPI
jgi:hypothetical protein